uniref:EF-hand domain-containing protein n=1 Tax=Alexandrium catenella TaxID=2925 RepID=A0A7S1Q813_ALECA|mmetsp:Transcript_2043/g.5453  ORF Transcript_2043/g.5453 Transcript_2043/m.5453 type:complete len:650 (+) Transcript_2043:140-2089(+)
MCNAAATRKMMGIRNAGEPERGFAGSDPAHGGVRTCEDPPGVCLYPSEVSSLKWQECKDKAPDDAWARKGSVQDLNNAMSILASAPDSPSRGESRSTIKIFLSKTHDSLSLDNAHLSWRRKVWILMEEPSNHPVALKVHYCYSLLIILSVLSTVIQSIDNLAEDMCLVLMRLELFFNTLFTLEVLARIICAPQKTVLLRNMYMWMDFGAIVPFYIVLIFDSAKKNMYCELMVLLIPILRLLKITRHSVGWRILMQSVRECAEPLCVPAFLLLLMTVIASCVIFWLEKHFGPAEEEEKMVFDSIPHAMWFVICTISTVGYGDVTPRSPVAKTAAATLILGGVCYMAMPLAIIGGTFVNVYQERERLLLREKTFERFTEGGITQAHLRLLFEAADQDSSGAVKRSEFVEMVEAFQLGFSREQIVKLFFAVDTNGSGEITFDEFAFFLFPELDVPDMLEDEGSPKTFGKQESLAARSNASEASTFTSRRQSMQALRSGMRSSSRSATLAGAHLPEPSFMQRRSEERRRSGSEASPAWPGGASRLAFASRPPEGESSLAAAGSFSLRERMERLELSVMRLGTEQRQHFEANQRILQQLAAKLDAKLPSTSQDAPSTRLPSTEHSFQDSVPEVPEAIPADGRMPRISFARVVSA